jgi:Prokaryotic E2 family E
MPIADQQFVVLKDYYPLAELRTLPSGAHLITLPNVPLPQGWSQPQTTLFFIAPVGYPLAKPDCFWADHNLRLSHGGMPQAANITPIPEINQPQLWFSWHTEHWNPNRDNLLTYLRVIQGRFKKPQ